MFKDTKRPITINQHDSNSKTKKVSVGNDNDKVAPSGQYNSTHRSRCQFFWRNFDSQSRVHGLSPRNPSDGYDGGGQEETRRRGTRPLFLRIEFPFIELQSSVR